MPNPSRPIAKLYNPTYVTTTTRTRLLYLPAVLLGVTSLSVALASCEDDSGGTCSGGGWEDGFVSVVDVDTVRLYGVGESAAALEMGSEAAIDRSDTLGIVLEYVYDLYAETIRPQSDSWASTGFGLIGTAYAIPGPTYTSNGQAFLDVDVVTLRDLDDLHSAGASVGDLLHVQSSPVDTAGYRDTPYYEARLGIDYPEVDTLQFEIVTTVSDGQVLRAQTAPIVVR